MDEKQKRAIIARIEEVKDQLMSRGVGGQRVYGCDEWSAPVVNLTHLVAHIEQEFKEKPLENP